MFLCFLFYFVVPAPGVFSPFDFLPSSCSPVCPVPPVPSSRCFSLCQSAPFQTQTITQLGEELYMVSLSEHTHFPPSTFVVHKPPPPTQYGRHLSFQRFHPFCGPDIKIMWVFVNSAPPHKVTLKHDAKLPMIRQYHLPHKAISGIAGVIQSLLDQGVLVQTTSPCNTPILPIPKANRPDEWRFVQDLQAINNIVVPTAPIVPDTNSILASLPSSSKYYTVTDLSSAFFSIPLHPDSQYRLHSHIRPSSKHGDG